MVGITRSKVILFFFGRGFTVCSRTPRTDFASRKKTGKSLVSFFQGMRQLFLMRSTAVPRSEWDPKALVTYLGVRWKGPI